MITYKEGSEITSKLLSNGAFDIISPPLSSEIISNRIGTILEAQYLRKELEMSRESDWNYRKLCEERDTAVKELNSVNKELKERSTELLYVEFLYNFLDNF